MAELPFRTIAIIVLFLTVMALIIFGLITQGEFRSNATQDFPDLATDILNKSSSEGGAAALKRTSSGAGDPSEIECEFTSDCPPGETCSAGECN